MAWDSPAIMWNCFLWMEGGLQLSGHYLAPQYWFQAWTIPLSHICLFSSFPLQAPWAAQVAGALPSGHKSLVPHCKAGGKCLLLKPSGAWSDQVGFITCLLRRLPLETSQGSYSHLFLPCQVHTCAKSVLSTPHQWSQV